MPYLGNLPSDELLHALRGVQESQHFTHIHRLSGAKWLMTPTVHKPIDFDNSSQMRLEDAVEACNRTAPIYLLRDLPDPQDLSPHRGISFFEAELFLVQLHAFTWDRWFRPYRSEIDRRQFLTKPIVPPLAILPTKTCSLAMVDWVKKLHTNFCDRAKHIRSIKFIQDDPARPDPRVDPKLYVMQPLFYAVAVIHRMAIYDFESTSDIGAIPVVIASTGIEQGLSAPIDFSLIPDSELLDKACDSTGRTQAVETTLRTAFDFLMALEKREARVFGLIPDPVESTRNLNMSYDNGEPMTSAARRLGWDNDTLGPLHGPSSSWVDIRKYPTWTGKGASTRQSFDGIIRFYRRLANAERESLRQNRPDLYSAIKMQSFSAN